MIGVEITTWNFPFDVDFLGDLGDINRFSKIKKALVTLTADSD